MYVNVSFKIMNRTELIIKISDLQGKIFYNLNATCKNGDNNVIFDVSNFAQVMYICQILSNVNDMILKKLIVQ